MSSNNPFAKLGAVEQKLYQETAPKPRLPVTEGVREKAPSAESQNAGKPANQYSRLPATQKASKLANRLARTPENKHSS